MNGDRSRVLVCDDDEDMLVAVEIALQQRFEVATTSSGSEAVERARGGGCDALVLDWMMPGMDGIEVLRQLRDDVRTRALPAVMLTARQMPGSERTCLSAGASAYIGKPFDPQVLVLLIEELLRDQVKDQAWTLIRELAERTNTTWGVPD